jgi:hypothetical protein
MDGMRQSACINDNMAFDARNLLSGVVAFFLRRISILHALCINDAETGFAFPAISQTFFAD